MRFEYWLGRHLELWEGGRDEYQARTQKWLQCFIPYSLAPCHDDHFPEVRSTVYLGYLPCLLPRVWPCGPRVSVFTPVKLFSSVELKKMFRKGDK